MGGGSGVWFLKMNNISLDHVRSSRRFDFKNNFDELHSGDSAYSVATHSCDYYDIDRFREEFVQQKLSTFSCNVQSLPGKWSNFRDLIVDTISKDFKFSVIAIQELWNVPSGTSYSLPGYKQLEYKIRDPSGRRGGAGGGVGVWVDDGLDYEILDNLSVFEPNFFESLFLKINTGRNKFFIIGNIYRPNTGPTANLKLFIDKLNTIIAKIYSDPILRKCDDIQLVGDFNIDLLHYQHHPDTTHYVDSLLSHGLLPLITKPTRICGRSATIIDHISTTYKGGIIKTGVIETYISDHLPIFLIQDSPIPKKPVKEIVTRKINANNILYYKNFLETSAWSIVTDENRPKNAFDNFFNIMDSSFEMSFPETKIKMNKSIIPINQWMSSGLLRSRRRKELLAVKKLKRPTEENIKTFKEYNSLYNKVRRAAMISHYDTRFNQLSKDIKATWETTREILGNKKQRSTLPSYFISGQNIIRGNNNIAAGFNNYFSNIGKELAEKIPTQMRDFAEFLGPGSEVNFVFSPLSHDDLEAVMKTIKPKNSSGPDKISSKIIKEIFPAISIPLRYLINLSLQTGFIPERFKVAKVIPIYKSGQKNLFTNYRPISLLSSFSKILEKVVATQMNRYLRAKNILYIHQYSFRKGHNTSHPVIHFLRNIYNALNDNDQNYSMGVFIDLKKAFDTVNHTILLRKLHHYGFRGMSYLWFENYLRGRVQFVQIEDVASEKRQIECGVPQGSVLGPLLFLLYINDLHLSTNLFTILFADDTTFQHTSLNLNDLFDTVNTELEKIRIWFQSNKLTLNVSKTKFMIFTKKRRKINTEGLELKIGQEAIERIGDDLPTSNFKFLGHVIDEHLTWKDHINHIHSKMSSGNYALARCKHFLPQSVRLTLYNSLVKPHLEYGILAWGGVGDSLLKKITIIQKKAVRNIAGRDSRARSNPLFQSLSILKINDIYKYSCSTFMHKYVNQNLPSSFNGMFQPLSEPNRTKKFVTARPRSKFLEQFPSVHLPKIWNDLSLDLKNTTKLISFKNKLFCDLVAAYSSNEL